MTYHITDRIFRSTLSCGAESARRSMTVVFFFVQGNPPCFAAYKGYEKALGILCRGIIRNVNAFWTALGFCLWMFLVLGTVSHFLSKYFLRMVNWTYDGSEVESYTSSSSTGSSSSKSGGSSPKAGAEKPEGAPPDHPDAPEAKGEGAEPQKEAPKDDLKDTQ
ncbi:uncharacterized protein [Dermacentor andersoni]|uniref:uncharacterized protein n=1 Tax=Dermacentor andersoni TaxID=34620 RepID=UPI002416F701|nr:uncharacterized protein LOC129380120 [Dermacentor andersoni]